MKAFFGRDAFGTSGGADGVVLLGPVFFDQGQYIFVDVVGC